MYKLVVCSLLLGPGTWTKGKPTALGLAQFRHYSLASYVYYNFNQCCTLVNTLERSHQLQYF